MQSQSIEIVETTARTLILVVWREVYTSVAFVLEAEQKCAKYPLQVKHLRPRKKFSSQILPDIPLSAVGGIFVLKNYFSPFLTNEVY